MSLETRSAALSPSLLFLNPTAAERSDISDACARMETQETSLAQQILA